MRLIVIIFLAVFSFSVNAANVPSNRLSLDIQAEKNIFNVFDDIEFSLILTPRADGELPTWETTSVDFEIIRLVKNKGRFEEIEDVINGDLDQRNELSQQLFPDFPDITNPNVIDERIPSTMPEVEYVFRKAGDTYSRKLNLKEHIFSTNDAEIVSLPLGIYRLKIKYYLSLGEDEEEVEEAKIDFSITAKDKIVETIDYWADVIANPSSTENEYVQITDYAETFTYQFYLDPESDLEMRKKAAKEYSLWARNRGESRALINEPFSSQEILESPESIRRKPIELYDFGDASRTVDTPFLELSGRLRTFLSGFYSLEIINNRIPENRVIATRLEYDSWTASIPLVFGSNRLSLIARDFEGLESTTTITVEREFE